MALTESSGGETRTVAALYNYECGSWDFEDADPEVWGEDVTFSVPVAMIEEYNAAAAAWYAARRKMRDFMLAAGYKRWPFND